jgi:hypothetical protein
MKCEQCHTTLGKDVTMEDLGAGQYQCPDCRYVVAPDVTVQVVAAEPVPETVAADAETLPLPSLDEPANG